MSRFIDVHPTKLIAVDGTPLTGSSSSGHSLAPSKIILPEAESSFLVLAGDRDTALSKDVKLRRLMDDLCQGRSNAKKAAIAGISLDALHYDQAAVEERIRQHEAQKQAYAEILAS